MIHVIVRFVLFLSEQRWPSHLTVCGCWLRSTCRQQQCYTSWHQRYCDTLHRRLSWLPQLPMIKLSERNTWIRWVALTLPINCRMRQDCHRQGNGTLLNSLPYRWQSHYRISIGNSMICSDIWHKYHKRYFEIVIRNCEWNLRQFWNITSGVYAKYHIQIMLLFVYITTHKRFVIFRHR